jgi:amidase
MIFFVLLAVFYARTTMPQAGMLLETWSNLFGRTLNPRNPDFGAGGSSGGDGALLAMHGGPVSPSTDIGGSIRAPAAFNGLYGIRPTADRVPKYGITTPAPGNTSIKVSCGPNCHSLADLKMFTKVILTHETVEYEPTASLTPWRGELNMEGKRLSIGLMLTDNVVDPHPPIQRALVETAKKLRQAGHEGMRFMRPICQYSTNKFSSIRVQAGLQFLASCFDHCKFLFARSMATTDVLSL